MKFSVYPGRRDSRKVSKTLLACFGCSYEHHHTAVRRSYKQRALETHPDKVPSTASEEEKKLAQDLFYQVNSHPIFSLGRMLTQGF